MKLTLTALALAVGAHAQLASDTWPACYVSAGLGKDDDSFAGVFHKTHEAWNGSPIYKRGYGEAWLGQHETGLWAFGTSRTQLVVDKSSTIHASEIQSRPSAVKTWLERGNRNKVYTHLQVRQGTHEECEAEWPDCYFVHNEDYSGMYSGYYSRLDEEYGAAPLYYMAPGANKGGAWLGQTPGSYWSFVEDKDAFARGQARVYGSLVERPEDVDIWRCTDENPHPQMRVTVRIAHGECYEVPPLDTAIPWGGTGDVVPVNGTHYIADFNVNDTAESASYQYPHILREGFRYIMDIRPSLPHAVVSMNPRIVYFEKFLPDEDSDAIIEIARQQLERSRVALTNPASQDGAINPGVDNVRTSYQTWLTAKDPPVQRLIDRILAVTGFRRNDAEQLQILRYSKTQNYRAHHDYFDPQHYGPQSTNRMMTCFIYFNTVQEGGWTWFPRANWQEMNDDTWIKCEGGFRTIPTKGSVVCFYNLTPARALDPYSLHAGCPVIEGEKWGGTLWIRTETPHMNVAPTPTAETQGEADAQVQTAQQQGAEQGAAPDNALASAEGASSQEL